MNTNVKIGIGSASGVLIGGIAGYLVSRKFHKKATDQVADEILHEMVPSMFQTMTTMVTAFKDMASSDTDFSGMSEEEVFNVYQKILSNAFEFFNLTMKEKYGVEMQLEMHREPKENGE